MLFYRTHKNRLKSAKILPRVQNFLTRFSNYTAVKDFDPNNDFRLVEYFEIQSSSFDIQYSKTPNTKTWNLPRRHASFEP